MVHSSLSMNQFHLFTQKLNNSAALCIEIGHYDRAIFSLTKALRLSREQTDESMLCGCRCQDCSLDGCIAYSESSPPVSKIAPHTRNESIDNKSCGYVYRRPIRVPPKPILENHNMGRTLFLIVTFNLALVHHLSALASSTSTSTSTSPSSSIPSMPNQQQELQQQDQQTQVNRNSNKIKIKKALQLYEVSNNWHARIMASRPPTGHDCDDNTKGALSIRFRMILSNNLSHIHCLLSNHTKHRQYLERLLSTVMVAVEYKTRNNNSNTSISSNNRTETYEILSSHHEGDLCTTKLEGFLMNASRLFLKHHCADAA